MGARISLLVITAALVIVSYPVLSSILYRGHGDLFGDNHDPVPHWFCLLLYFGILSCLGIPRVAKEITSIGHSLEQMMRSTQITALRFLGVLLLGPLAVTFCIYAVLWLTAMVWLMVIAVVLYALM